MRATKSMVILARLKDAWKNRHTLGDGDSEVSLKAFLPAALEIQETPPNPLARWLVKSIIGLLTIGVIWAIFGHVNIVATAEGKILPGSRVKIIQPLQKGVIKKILISEGDYVVRGQPLIEFDSTLTSADENRLKKELFSAEMKIAINHLLLKKLNSNDKEYSDGLVKEIVEKEKVDQRHFSKLLQEKWLKIKASESSLNSAREATVAEYKATKIEIEKFKKTLPIVEKRAKILKGLFEKKFASETEYLQVEQERILQSHQLQAEKQHLKQLAASRKQAQQQIDAFLAETKAGILTEITEYKREHSALQEELTKATDANQRQILYAPVAGQMQEVAVTTLGGVVTEAQPLMKIVPTEENLIVEAFIQNKDIGFIENMMPAEVKIHTFPFTKYGIVEAEVVNISDDAIYDEKRGLIYSLLLSMNKKMINVDGRQVPLMPGMEVTAELKTGERRLIEYFLAPLLRHGSESLRER
ncbi:MAG: HlyD family type I secretion periplasmic adaptor subunit [Candidatus Thiodiazotropha taylori]